jgi:ribosome biogenesis GTPase
MPPPPASPGLDGLGWSAELGRAFEAAAGAGPGLEPARVCLEFMGGYRVLTARGEFQAALAGKMRHAGSGPDTHPVVGDWVAARVSSRPDDPALIEALLPRRTWFSRRAAGKRNVEQVLAANIDTVLLLASLEGRVRPRALERYLVPARQGGASVAIVLTKADHRREPESLARAVAEVASAAPGIPVHPVSVVAPSPATDPHTLARYLGRGQTIALLGPSGAGKSTLANHWLGQQSLATGDVRSDDLRGRHTTTHRHLLALPTGALVIDTPGLRELQLWEPGHGLDDTFADIAQLAANCRFNDCQHHDEPGCAVRSATTNGQLDPARLDSFHKLADEKQTFDAARPATTRATRRRQAQPGYRRERGSPTQDDDEND